MNQYIISVIESINALCNIGFFLWIFILYQIMKNDAETKNGFWITGIILLLAVIFIPNKESLMIFFP